jgi:hypothetical protein
VKSIALMKTKEFGIKVEKNIVDLATEAGYKPHEYDTALPQDWVNHVWEITQKSDGKGRFPYGFIWSYRNSQIWGEPIPLTDEARELAEQIGVKPR